MPHTAPDVVVQSDLRHHLHSTMRSTLTGLVGVTLLVVTIGWSSIQPSNQREWSEDQRLMPRAEFIDHYVTIANLRDFRWGPGAEVRPASSLAAIPAPAFIP